MIGSKFQALRDRARDLAIVAATSAPVLAFAQTTDPFTTALEDATEKVGTYAAALVGLAAVSVIFMIAVKYVKKIKGAA